MCLSCAVEQLQRCDASRARQTRRSDIPIAREDRRRGDSFGQAGSFRDNHPMGRVLVQSFRVWGDDPAVPLRVGGRGHSHGRLPDIERDLCRAGVEEGRRESSE